LTALQYRLLLLLSAVALVLAIVNAVMFSNNRQAQNELATRGQYIQQSLQLEPLYQSLIKSLADLKGKDVSFGSQSSTSGHLMPRAFLLQNGLNPDKDFKRVAYSGAHDATIAAVASGKVQAGALNISVWDKFVADKKVEPGKVRVFFTTPPYYDYNWTVHADMPASLREKLAAALLALKKDTPEGKEILDLQRATRFVPTKVENYKGIEAAAQDAALL
jgi:phosphonate transport system substrate-binding protein